MDWTELVKALNNLGEVGGRAFLWYMGVRAFGYLCASGTIIWCLGRILALIRHNLDMENEIQRKRVGI